MPDDAVENQLLALLNEIGGAEAGSGLGDDQAALVLDHSGLPVGDLCLAEGDEGASLGEFYRAEESGGLPKDDFCRDADAKGAGGKPG